MSVTFPEASSLLESVLFESATLAASNAASWVALSSSASADATIAGLAQAMALSPEAGIAEQVVRYYEGALGRPPSGSEIAYYVAIAEAGLSATQIAEGASAVPQATWNIIADDFANSPEFKFTLGGSSVVTLLYLNILGRSPGASEIAFYQAQLASGFSTGTLVQEFVTSPEYQSAANPQIVQALATYGTSVVANTMVPNTLNPITVGSTVSVTLTTAADTASADTFFGTLGGFTPTLQGSDSLTGIGSANSLTITDGAAAHSGLVLPAGLTLTNIQTLAVSTANNVGSSGGQSFDVSSYPSVTMLNVKSAGNSGDIITAGTGTAVTDDAFGTGGLSITGGNAVVALSAAGPITIQGARGNISVTETLQGTAAIGVDGGSAVSVTATGASSGSITVGANTAPSGAVSVSESNSASLNGGTTGSIAVSGGSSVSIMEAVTAAASAIAAGATITIAPITVTGSSSTNTVTVSEQAPAAARLASGSSSNGQVGVAAVAGAPGVTAVALVAAVAAASSSAASLGVADGAVTITDAGHASTTTSGNSITTVSLTNAAAGSAIVGNALATLTLAGRIGGLAITNAATAASNTTLSLTLNQATVVSLTDSRNEITSLTVVTAGSGASSVALLHDTGLTAISLSGTQSLVWKEALADYAALTSIAVSVSAGFSGDISGIAESVVGTVTSGSTIFSTTSSGSVSLVLDGDATHQQSFVGATGTDDITLDADIASYAPVAAGGAGNNELILTDGVSYSQAGTGSKATGFTVLGLEGNPNSGVADLLNLQSWASAFSTINVLSADAAIETVTHFAGKAITLSYFQGSGLYTGLVVNTADGNGAGDAMTVTLANTGSTYGAPATAAIGSLTLADGNSVGLATVNLISGNAGFNTQNSIFTLVDNGLSLLTVSGSGGLSIGTLDEVGTPAASLTINATETNASGVSIATLTDNSLGALTFSGSNRITITTLDDSAAFISLSNSGSLPAAVGTLNANSLVNLTLGSGVALGQGASVAAETSLGLQDSSTAGVTVAGGADNAHVSLTLAGAGAGSTDSITLGNGNNYLSDASIATTAAVNITVGSGSNDIITGSGTAAAGTSALFTITLATARGAGIEAIAVGVAGANFASAPSVVIANAAVGDQISLSADHAASTTVQSVSTNGTSVATTLALLEASSALTAAHGLVTTSYGGNSYIAESLSGTPGAHDTTVIELVGLHSVSSAGGVLTVTG